MVELLTPAELVRDQLRNLLQYIDVTDVAESPTEIYIFMRHVSKTTFSLVQENVVKLGAHMVNSDEREGETSAVWRVSKLDVKPLPPDQRVTIERLPVEAQTP